MGTSEKTTQPIAAVAAATPSQTVQRVILPLAGLGADQLVAWRALAGRAAEPNPFFRPEFVLAEGADDRDAILVVVTEGTRWIGCLPLVRARRYGRLRLPCLAPWRPDRAFLATPLVDRDRVEPATGALAAFVAAERRAAAVVLAPVDPAGVVGAALGRALTEAGCRVAVHAEFERAALHRRPEPTYVSEGLTSKRRKELRRLRRALEREVGEIAVEDLSGDAEASEAFLELERRGWKGEAGTAMGSTPTEAEFFRVICRSLSPSGALQLLALRAGERVAAMQCNLVEGDTLFGFKVAYEPELARFAPGVLLEIDAVDLFHERSELAFADSCAAPDNELMNRLWPDRRRLQHLVLPTRAPTARLVRPMLRAEALGRAAVRRARRLRRSARRAS